MEIAHIFTAAGIYQFQAHENGTYDIVYKSNWNSTYDYEKNGLFFQDFLKEYTQIIRKVG